MPNLAQNLSGITAASLTITGDATISGRTTAAGFTSSTNGTVGTPAYNFSSDVDCGIYHSGVANRYELAAGGADVHSIRTALSHAYVPFSMGSTGTITGGNFTMGTGRKLILDNNLTTTDLPLQFNGDPNTGIGWDSADYIRYYAGGSFIAGVSSSAGLVAQSVLTISNNAIFPAGSYIEMTEGTAPASPAADKVRIYAVVDGGSLTDLAAKFQDGTVDIFAQEV